VARPRRLRRTPALRALVAETSLRPRDLVLPVFVKEGIGEPQPIGSMPGVVQHTRDSLRKAAAEAVGAGVGGLIVFGVPAVKDGRGSAADDPAGISQLAVADLRAEVGDGCVVMADLCLCEYTDHGHCGVLKAPRAGGPGQDLGVDNDATLPLLAKEAVAHARAGADIVAPSDMMDGRVAAIRKALDETGYSDVPILSYAAKFAGAFYGPFRDAAESAPREGPGIPRDRKGYQMDPGNVREALREVALDVAEGADMVMVKPAVPYLDIVRLVKDRFELPVAAYHVSGEYAMIKAAAERGWIDEDRVAQETLLCCKRAGADLVLTYYAKHVAGLLTGNRR
jgi:porphobilinogen synthase